MSGCNDEQALREFAGRICEEKQEYFETLVSARGDEG